MRKAAFRTVRTTRTSAEAEALTGVLRKAGLHPVDLVLSAPFALPGERPKFPVQVPNEEADAAESILGSTLQQAA